MAKMAHTIVIFCFSTIIVLAASTAVPPAETTTATDVAAPADPAAPAAPAEPESPTSDGLCTTPFVNKCVDCRNIAICGGGPQPMITKSCASLNSNRQYCSEGACTDTAPGASCDANFECSNTGYFPSPENCSKYYLCNSVNGSAHEYDCGPNQFYNAREYTCQSITKATDCKTLDCSLSVNSYIRHPVNPAYYAFCLNTPERVSTVVYKCPNENTSEFNLKTFTCDFKCPQEGRFPHEDCKKFYECYNSANGLEANEWACPSDFKFSKKEKRCVLGTCE